MNSAAAGIAHCRLMVATPIYEGAQGSYVRAVLALALAAQAEGLSVRFEFILYQPSITRARNMLVGMFLASDCTHLMFVDADIDFEPESVFSMLKALEDNEDVGVLGAPYPRRMMNWRNVARAAALGLGDENEGDLSVYSGEFPLHFLNPGQSFSLNELVELTRLGTGLMLIRRVVLESMRDAFPELAYRPDAGERQTHGVGEWLHAFFSTLIDPDSRAILSDDYSFCRRVRDAGHRIWLAPWIKTTHSGPCVFKGTLSDLARLSAASQATKAE